MQRPLITALSLLALSAAGLGLAGAAERPTAPAALTATSADAKPFKVDTVHSSIVFAIQHNHLNDVFGRFNAFSGEFHIDAANPSASTLSITVDVGSVDTGNKGRETHITGPDFFSTKEFPKASFTSTGFTKTGENQFDVAGDFEMHGVKKPVTVKLDYRGEAKGGRNGELNTSGFVATVTIKRSEFGMKKYLENLGDDVRLTVSLQGAQ